jgi:cation-transporting P-type ATPase F
MAAVALAVGAIPEGLPAAVTITLAIGVARMARRGAVIRKLPAVETLGGTTVICSDKTGTLTENQMTVQEIWAGGMEYSVSGVGYAPHGSIDAARGAAEPGANTALTACLTAGLVCNDSALAFEDGRWELHGDPTEGSLIAAAAKAGLDAREIAQRLPRLDSIPFESQHQYMATLHDAGEAQPRVVFVKGAVEAVLSRCRALLSVDGIEIPLDADEAHRRFESMASRGLRVLAFARGALDPRAEGLNHPDIASGLTLVGLQGMIDPPRAEAIAAVKACRRAGVRVKMITGDHAVTAAAIARRIGLLEESGDSSPAVLPGAQLAALPEAALPEAADRGVVFARVTPEQKLRLVRALQARHQVVAMTGDGVNDAPALRQADIGVAMGVAGTEAAKEAADMVLTDDNFATIAAAVEEGRGVFDNLTKFIVWTLPTNLGEGLLILAAIFAHVTLPILPLQILWINMTTAMLLGLTLAFEPKEAGLMDRPPRDPREPILTGALILRILLVAGVMLTAAFGLFEWALRIGNAVPEARTLAVNVIVFTELFYLFNCRSLTRSMFAIGPWSNPWVVLGVVTMAALQLLFTYLPLMNRVFQSAPIGPLEWLGVAGASAFAYGVVGIEKRLRRGGPRVPVE